MNNLNTMQDTLRDLKEIVQRNQGADHESAMVVRRIEHIVAEIERKTRKSTNTMVVSPVVQAIPLV